MTAHVRNEGDRQVIVLPTGIRFTTDSIEIEQDASGRIVLGAPQPAENSTRWGALWKAIDEANFPDDFLADRDMRPAEDHALTEI